MKTIVLAAAALGLAGALAGVSAAVAAERASPVTDVAYLKTVRCVGLADSFGVGDAAGLAALLKAEGASRNDAVYMEGREEMSRAKRDAAKSDRKDRLMAELTGPCAVLLGASQTAANGR